MRWLYQSKAEPVFVETPAETPSVASWAQELSIPTLAPEYPTPDLFGFLVEQTLVTEPVVADWNRPLSEPLFDVPPIVPEGISGFFVEPTLFVVPDGIGVWTRQTEQPVFDREPQREFDFRFFVGEPSDFTPAETVTLDKWFRQLSEPTLPFPPRETGLFGDRFEPTLYIEPPSASAWARPLSEPMRLRPSIGPLWDVTQQEPPTTTITVDMWFRQSPEPFEPPPDSMAGLFGFVVEPLIVAAAPDLDSWYVPLSIPTLPEPPGPDAWEPYPFDPDAFTVAPSMATWFVQWANPVLPEPRAHASVGGTVNWTDYMAIVAGPYYAKKREVFVAGASAAEVFQAGAAKSEVFIAGAGTQEVT